MICPNCGAENEDSYRFCVACGAKLEVDSIELKEADYHGKNQLARPKVNPNIFIHPLDREALNALKAIPGFTQLLKAFMKVFSERQFRIENMSSNIRINEKQMSKYYDMLPPICDRLGIDVPELYLELDVSPNAYTAGDTQPFIVMTSGLLESLPDELIPTILAHECGHIVCHHVLYQTMGAMILGGFSFATGAANLITMPLKWAFAYWLRCSEFSADRAAALCDESPENVMRMCSYFAGYNKSFGEELNMEAFMEQALEYRELVNSSAWNKALEFYMYNQNSHPLSAVRAYECNEWCHTKQYERAIHIINKDYSA